jgi:hypothetical protein
MSEDKKHLPMVMDRQYGIVVGNSDELQRLARIFVSSKMFAEKDGDEALARASVKILAGQEIGVKPFQAMRNIDIIQGTPAYRYQLVAAKVKQSKRYDFSPVESTDKVAKIQFYDRGKPVFLSVFTMEDATKQGLAGKDGYKRMPADMLYARAMTKGVNKVCPEVFFGECYSPEDFGEASAEGFSIEVEATETTESQAVEVITPAPKVATEPPKPVKVKKPIQSEDTKVFNGPPEPKPETTVIQPAPVVEAEEKVTGVSATTGSEPESLDLF